MKPQPTILLTSQVRAVQVDGCSLDQEVLHAPKQSPSQNLLYLSIIAYVQPIAVLHSSLHQYAYLRLYQVRKC